MLEIKLVSDSPKNTILPQKITERAYRSSSSSDCMNPICQFTDGDKTHSNRISARQFPSWKPV